MNMAKNEKKKADADGTKTGKEETSSQSLIVEAGPDDPIYKRGFVVGGYYSKNSFPNTRETPPQEEDPMPEEERHQDPKRR